MRCPKCNGDMEFEEVKNYHGIWFCDCGYEVEGSCMPCDYDYEDGRYVCTDHEERIENE